MSLAIDIDHVTAVLLADGWHHVTNDSFDIDSYEYLAEGIGLILGGGSEPLIPARGATWTEEDGSQICAPVTAVLAVRKGPRP